MGRPAPFTEWESELVNHGRSFDRIDGWVGPKFRARTITSEPLVEVAVRQFQDRVTRLFCSSAHSSDVHQIWEGKLAKDRNPQPWNEAPLNFVSLRSSLHYAGLEGLSRVEMNAQKTGALDSPSNSKREVCFTFRLTRPTTS